MTVNNTESLGANSSSETRSVFYCPKSPHFIWDLNHTTSLKIILAITTIACPVTILLNLLVIIAVKTRRELKKNSKILLSSLAVADLLVGAVSMPLSITLDALVLQGVLVEDVICTIDTIVFALYTVYSVSFIHLVLIAWERHVAIVKWMDYKVIATKERLKKYATVAWLSASLTIAPGTIMEAAGVPYKVLLALDVIICVLWIVCFCLIIYFYIKVYKGVQNRNRTQNLPVNAMVRAKHETELAYTTFWLTLFAGISGVPAVVIYMFGGFSPFLRKNSFFRWADTMFQLNSLANPLLYFYRSRQLRKTALELLRCRKRQLLQPVACTVGRIRQRRYSVASLDVEELQSGQKRPRFEKSQSCGIVMCSYTVRQRSNKTVNERPITTSKIANDRVTTQQHNEHVVTVQIENAQRKKRNQQNNKSPKDTLNLKKSRHRMVGQIERSTSLTENSFVALTNFHQNAAERNFKRSTSFPILSTNLNTLDNRLTVAELSRRKGHALNSYEDTKL